MSQPPVVWEQLRPYLQAFRKQYLLWVVPTVALTCLALLYALFMPKTWRASQAYQVRDEVIGNDQHQGQFDSIDHMKVFQETIQQIARHRIVVSATLRKLGPPPGSAANTNWPTDEAIESFQSQIRVTSPKGTDFGRSDMFFVSVSGRTPAEAVQRTRLLCDELERYLSELRDAKAQSIVTELDNTRRLAQADLDEATARLEVMERQVGEDLGELRVLNEVGSGDSNLRRGLSEVNAELRQAEFQRESLQQLQGVLKASNGKTETLLATPSRLLDSQPALKRLKEGLVDAQIRCATLRGRLNDLHPTVIAAVRTEEEIRRQLHSEVDAALKGVEHDLAANETQISQLRAQQANLQSRLDRLATMRARYSNLVLDVKRRSEIVDKVKKDLANAQATQNAATATSRLTRFHDPVPEDRPEGPGKRLIVMAGLGGGLAAGAGLVFLFMPIGPNGTGRRWNDYLNIGRRATDRFLGRRHDDRKDGAARGAAPVVPRASTPAPGRRNGDAEVSRAPPQDSPAHRANSERRQSTGRRSADIH